MLFNSYEFSILVAVAFLLYYLPGMRRLQPIILIVASFTFYGYNQPYLLVLLVASIAINAASSWFAIHLKLRSARIVAAAGIIANLAVLASFKYAGLLTSTFLGISTDGGSVGHFIAMIPLPVGISFFTFQGMSLVADAFSARTNREFKNLIQDKHSAHWVNTTLFISFFPQLVAGPIVKAHEFLPQIKDKFLRDIDWRFCFRMLVLGYFLKMVVADNLKDLTYRVEYPYSLSLSSIELISLLFGYSMQIFADFAGYSLIAIGVGGLFGYRLPINFNFPYIARSFSEFWHRWHISLSSWLRDYLYIPLGGNKRGRRRTYLNLFLVMFLGGLWHGAAWSYAIWGTVHGGALAVERLFRRVRLPEAWPIRCLQVMGVFTFVTVAWLLFRLPDFSDVLTFFKCIAMNWRKAPDLERLHYIGFYSFPVVAYHFLYLMRKRPEIAKFIHKLEPVAFGLLLFLLLLNHGLPGEFIYFQF